MKIKIYRIQSAILIISFVYWSLPVIRVSRLSIYFVYIYSLLLMFYCNAQWIDDMNNVYEEGRYHKLTYNEVCEKCTEVIMIVITR